MDFLRSIQKPPLQKDILCADGTSGILLSLGIPSISHYSIWILFPCFFLWERGQIFESFIFTAHSTLLLSPSCSRLVIQTD